MQGVSYRHSFQRIYSLVIYVYLSVSVSVSLFYVVYYVAEFIFLLIRDIIFCIMQKHAPIRFVKKSLKKNIIFCFVRAGCVGKGCRSGSQ